MIPDFLTVGHLAWDVTTSGRRLGGTAAYASVTALRMGLRPALLTSTGPDLDAASTLPGVSVHSVPAPASTVFRNRYHGGARTQRVTTTAGPLSARDVPQDFGASPLVLLGPLLGEVDEELAQTFPNATIVASLQGWLRQRSPDGSISPVSWDGADILPFVDAAVVSDEDLGDVAAVHGWAESTRVLIVTEGAAGARVLVEGREFRIAAFLAPEVDPTGAGDVFAAAYLIRYGETSDPVESARFAACAAAFCVEAEGTDGIPFRTQVEARIVSEGNRRLAYGTDRLTEEANLGRPESTIDTPASAVREP